MINNDIYRFGLDKYVPRRYYSDLKNKRMIEYSTQGKFPFHNI